MINLSLRDPDLVDKAKAAMAMRGLMPDEDIQEILDNAPVEPRPLPEGQYGRD